MGLLREAEAAIGRLRLAGRLVPSIDWLIFGFVRREALISSQVEGTQATLEDVLTSEATRSQRAPATVARRGIHPSSSMAFPTVFTWSNSTPLSDFSTPRSDACNAGVMMRL